MIQDPTQQPPVQPPVPQPQTPQQLDPDAVNLAKAIRQNESGGDFNKPGASGEHGAYQFTKAFWQGNAGKYLGDPSAPLTPENQNQVAYNWIKERKDAGMNPAQIASEFNSGSPNHVNDNHRGVNQYGVPYDTPAYVQKVYQTYQQLKNGAAATAQAADQAPTPDQQPQDSGPSALGFAGNVLSSGANFLGGIGSALIHPYDTVSNIAKLGAGALETGIFSGADALGIPHNKLPPTPEQQQFENVKNFYNQRYGISDALHGNFGAAAGKIGNTLYNDPVGAAADASMVFGGAAGLAGKAGEASDIANASRIADAGGTLADVSAANGASVPSRIASGLSTAADVTNPFYLPGKVVGGAANFLKNSAASSMTDVLAPTGKADKFLTEGVVNGRDVTLPSGEQFHVPGMVDRGMISGTREGMLDKVGQGLEDTGAKYDAAEANIPKDAQIQAQPILDQIDQAKKQYIIQGNNGPVVADPAAVQHLEDFQKTVQDLTANGNVSKESLTQLKQLWQQKVAKAGGYYGKTLAEGSQMDAMREAESAVRRQLDTQYPDLAKINAEFKFWKDAEKVLKDTIERKRGQSGIVRKGISSTLGAIAGSPFGFAGSGGTAYLAKLASDAFESPGWKTVSSFTKDRLAKAMTSGRIGEVGKILKTIGPTASQTYRAQNQAPNTGQ